MCNACGYPARPGHWTDAGLATAHDRLRARLNRVQQLPRYLAPLQLSAQDNGMSPGYRLSNRSGMHVMVQTLDELWENAARLAGRPVDPLDPALIGPDG
jgi:hypothetical protein